MTIQATIDMNEESCINCGEMTVHWDLETSNIGMGCKKDVIHRENGYKYSSGRTALTRFREQARECIGRHMFKDMRKLPREEVGL